MKPTKSFPRGCDCLNIVGLFNREEILEHLDSTLLSAEILQSHLDAAKLGGADELSVPSVRAHLEFLRTTLEVRHPSSDHDT